MELTDSNYKDKMKNNGKPVFLGFDSPTCSPCQMFIKLIDERLEAYGEEKGIKVVKCDTSRNPKLASAFNTNSVPFTILVMPDEKLKYTELGLKHKAYYFELIDKFVGKCSLFSR